MLSDDEGRGRRQAELGVGAHVGEGVAVASRDVGAWLKCRGMGGKIGEEFAGTVSAATAFGIFVTLDELYVEGLVHISELGGDYYRFDDVRQELRGERSGVRFGIGTRVRVQVSRVDLDGRKIDFRLVREVDDARLQAAGRGERQRPRATSEQRLEALEEADRASKNARSKARKATGKAAATKTAKGRASGGSAAGKRKGRAAR